MLTCKDLACAYGDNLVFKNFSGKIKRGSLLVIRGENGSGKTSLLEILAGLKNPFNGEITWDGENDEVENISNLAINYIGHRLAIKPNNTVKENVYFWASIFDGQQYSSYALKYFGLDEKESTMCSDLSAGWIKRVALARLICCPADIWILDEPYNNLDRIAAEKLDNLIRAKCSKGGIVVLSSHVKVPIENAVEINMSDYSLGKSLEPKAKKQAKEEQEQLEPAA